MPLASLAVDALRQLYSAGYKTASYAWPVASSFTIIFSLSAAVVFGSALGLLLTWILAPKMLRMLGLAERRHPGAISTDVARLRRLPAEMPGAWRASGCCVPRVRS